MGDLGVVFEKLGWRFSPPPPDPSLFTEECLFAAEKAAEEVVKCLHPTLDTEEMRRDVIDYIQRLIKSRFDCEVCPYGSVPLKTFLPDGDIDLTILKGPAPQETLPQEVHALLLEEEQNKNSEYKVRDIQFIDAEVKLVKLFVQDIVIDVSFNQLGGLSTLCFLEQVDRFVGKNHLFKRSIVLVKAWCYYESRILGSHYGLLSTYALEVLVLYIFQMFPSSLTGPLAVLYRFMEYFGQFDWENYCISLKGPICRSSLPDIVVKMPERDWSERLLSNEFLESCMELFSVQPSGLEDKPTKAFQIKFLNIIDPLKENNNLGRSVHRGNFYRVRTALKYGARRLGQILLQPKDKIHDDVREFFSDTLSRHGSKSTFRGRNVVDQFKEAVPLKSSSSSRDEGFSEEDRLLEVSDSYCGDISDEDYLGMSSEACQRSQQCSSSTENAVSPISDFKSWIESRKQPETMGDTYRWCMDDSQAMRETSANSPSLFVDERETESTSSGELEDLIDLTGGYESHVRNLLYGRLCNGCSSSVPLLHHFPSVYSSDHFYNPWDVVPQSMPLREDQFSQMNLYMGYMEHNMYPSTDYNSLAFAFHPEGSQMARGTGTYFPTQSGFCRDGSSSRGRTYGHHNHYRGYGRNNFSHRAQNEVSRSVHREVRPTRGNRSPSRGRGRSDVRCRSLSRGRGRSDVRCQTPRPIAETSQTNSDLSGSLQIEFGSVGKLAQGMISVDAEPSQESNGAAAVVDQEKASPERIYLKSEEEFPALCANRL